MSLLDKIDSVKKRFLADIENFPLESDKITQLKSSYLGRKGEIANLFSKKHCLYVNSGSSGKETGCCSLDSINDARNIAVDLGFHHTILDLSLIHI